MRTDLTSDHIHSFKHHINRHIVKLVSPQDGCNKLNMDGSSGAFDVGNQQLYSTSYLRDKFFRSHSSSLTSASLTYMHVHPRVTIISKS